MKVILLAATLVLLASSSAWAQEGPATAPWPSETSIRVQVAFTQNGDHPDVLLAEGIDRAQNRVDAALYALNRAVDVDALVNAQTRCGCVRLISDVTQSGQASQKAALLTIRAAGVPIRVDHHTGIMHEKLVMVDLVTVYGGSFNPTNAASVSNDEVLFRIDSPQVAEAVGTQFDQMWNDPARFVDWAPT